MTCPAGGGACVVSVAADGTAVYDRTGGVPYVHFRTPGLREGQPTAEDLLDHWNEPEQLRAALGLSVVDAADIADRKNAVKGVAQFGRRRCSRDRTRLRNVRPEDVEIIGERDGITYGRWTGGPAGTLNIEFDWRFAPDMTPTERAEAERAGKSWSRQLRDEFGTHVVEMGTTLRKPRRAPWSPRPGGNLRRSGGDGRNSRRHGSFHFRSHFFRRVHKWPTLPRMTTNLGSG